MLQKSEYFCVSKKVPELSLGQHDKHQLALRQSYERQFK